MKSRGLLKSPRASAAKPLQDLSRLTQKGRHDCDASKARPVRYCRLCIVTLQKKRLYQEALNDFDDLLTDGPAKPRPKPPPPRPQQHQHQHQHQQWRRPEALQQQPGQLPRQPPLKQQQQQQQMRTSSKSSKVHSVRDLYLSIIKDVMPSSRMSCHHQGCHALSLVPAAFQ